MDREKFHIVPVSDSSSASDVQLLPNRLLKGPLDDDHKDETQRQQQQVITNDDNNKKMKRKSQSTPNRQPLSAKFIDISKQSKSKPLTKKPPMHPVSTPNNESSEVKPAASSPPASSVTTDTQALELRIDNLSDIESQPKSYVSRDKYALKTCPILSPSLRRGKKLEFHSKLVTKVEEPNIQTTIAENQDGVNDNMDLEHQPLQRDIAADDYALYEDDILAMPTVSNFLSSFIFPGTQKEEAGRKKAKLGLLIGVYLPTMQHIFGVLMFLRLFWMVGNAGVIETLLMVFVCCTCTFLTSISMSAIATNGVVESGGAYFMLSRNLGPEFGSAVGLLFFLANAVATAMYLVGGVEILLTYVAPNHLPKFDETISENNRYNNYRCYGTGLLIIEFLIVACGVKVVQLFAPVSLLAVIVSIISIYIGSFVANPESSEKVCVLGDVLLVHEKLSHLSNGSVEMACNATILQSLYCKDINGTQNCDPYFQEHTPKWVSGVPGFASGVFKDNLFSYYLKKGESAKGRQGLGELEVKQDLSTSFFMLLAIYFPSVTGIMTGSNMSGDLADPQKSIPSGTIAAQLTSSFVYLSFVVVFGGTIIPQMLRDKLGQGLGGGMVTAQLAWPSHWILLIGSFLSTFGAALQCLCSAPRLLQSIAKDDVIPVLRPFARVTRFNEPFRALVLSTFLAELGVLIGVIDLIAPVVDFFFLVCYAFVNFACALQTLLGAPNWRPRFRFYHWTLSLLGAFLALFIMFATHWYYAIVSIVLCAMIYKYVEWRGAKKEWGDGIRGLALAGARYSLLNIEDRDMHTKNWRPQFLILNKLDDNDEPKYPKLLTLAGQLKAGRGLIMSAAVIVGDYADPKLRARCRTAQQNLKAAMQREKAKGFAQAVICTDEAEGIAVLVQSSGVGALRPNTVVVGWPNSWRKDRNNQNYYNFLDAIHRVATTDKCLIIPKGITLFPDNKTRYQSCIDVWWIIHDGGLLLLLPFLLRQHPVWKKCRMRVFAVATWKDNVEKMKADLNKWMYQLRIDAEVLIVELPDTDMSAYTFQKTLQMEERMKFLQNLHITNTDEDPQLMMDKLRLTEAPVRYSVKTEPQLSTNEDSTAKQIEFNEYTFSTSSSARATFSPGPSNSMAPPMSPVTADGRLSPGIPSSPTVFKKNIKKMHSAVRLNEIIRERSAEACLVIVNLPGPPRDRTGLTNYLDYLEVLTDGLERVLLARGTGREVITMYS